MITANDVLTVLRSNYDTEDYPEAELLLSCEYGLSRVVSRLKKGVSTSDPLITHTAAAVARFHFFIRSLTEPEKYESYRVGDVAVNCNPDKALEREKMLRDAALAEASSILEDGGFYCGYC